MAACALSRHVHSHSVCFGRLRPLNWTTLVLADRRALRTDQIPLKALTTAASQECERGTHA